MKVDGVRRRVAVRRLGRMASLSEVRRVEMAEGVKGGVIIRRESLVICARRVAAQVERSGRGEGLFGGGTVPSAGTELRELVNWSKRASVVVSVVVSLVSAIAVTVLFLRLSNSSGMVVHGPIFSFSGRPERWLVQKALRRPVGSNPVRG